MVSKCYLAQKVVLRPKGRSSAQKSRSSAQKCRSSAQRSRFLAQKSRFRMIVRRFVELSWMIVEVVVVFDVSMLFFKIRE